MILNDPKTDDGSKSEIISVFAAIIRDSFDIYHVNKDVFGVKSCLAATNSMNELIAEKNMMKNLLN